MSKKLYLDTVLVMDDSPMFMQQLQQEFDGNQIRFLFADTLDAFRHQLKDISGKNHALSGLLLGPSVDSQQVSSSLQHLHSQQPDCRWINIVDLDGEFALSAENLQERLKFRPHCTLLSNDEHGIKQVLSNCLLAVHQADTNDELKHRLSDIEERYEILLDTSSEAIAYVLSGLHIYANPAYMELTGFDDLRSLSEKSLLELISPNDPQDSLKKRLVDLEKGITKKANLDVSLIDIDDAPALQAILQSARYSGEDCTQVTLRERPVIAVSNEGAPAEIDGLLTRRGFLAETQKILSQDNDGNAIGVLCISVDDFDDIKDHVGFANSDAVISERGSLLLECLSEETDRVTRYSEHVFVAMVQRTQRPAVEQVVTHIVDSFSSRIAEVNDTSTTVTCSVGFCFAGRQTKNIDTLISQSVRAAREASAEGGQQHKRFRPTLQSVDDGNERAQWQERLRHAIDQNELKLVGTVISDINDDEQQILDLDLCLLKSEDMQQTCGTQLKQAIAGSALTAELDRHAMRVMLENLLPTKQTMMMPITPGNHDAKALADWIMASLKYAGMPGSRLIFSISSHDLQQNLQPTNILRKALAGTGIRWALDHYGATDNALQLVKHLRPEFVRLCPDKVPQNSDQARTEPFPSLVKAARENDSQIIACSVDSADCLPSLWQSGITLIQGQFLKQQQQLVG